VRASTFVNLLRDALRTIGRALREYAGPLPAGFAAIKAGAEAVRLEIHQHRHLSEHAAIGPSPAECPVSALCLFPRVARWPPGIRVYRRQECVGVHALPQFVVPLLQRRDRVDSDRDRSAVDEQHHLRWRP